MSEVAPRVYIAKSTHDRHKREIARLREQLLSEIASHQTIEEAYKTEIKCLKEYHESLRSDLATVTAERDRMMAAFEKAANDMRPMLRSMISRNEAEEIVRRAARAALEGVTEKEGEGAGDE